MGGWGKIGGNRLKNYGEGNEGEKKNHRKKEVGVWGRKRITLPQEKK